MLEFCEVMISVTRLNTAHEETCSRTSALDDYFSTLRRKATLRALEKCTVLQIHRKMFEALVARFELQDWLAEVRGKGPFWGCPACGEAGHWLNDCDKLHPGHIDAPWVRDELGDRGFSLQAVGELGRLNYDGFGWIPRPTKDNQGEIEERMRASCSIQHDR
eukprot:TRINITY_DN10130_c0_g1_i2.p1 TRINITY_DN10130_c0_g1~~TRINITY_DN10130_c0_g1_i2.p1  ORF type:complete len:162 (+),score=27.35 TRINITY_DN10130_c0_g1_i2:38-523(+)